MVPSGPQTLRVQFLNSPTSRMNCSMYYYYNALICRDDNRVPMLYTRVLNVLITMIIIRRSRARAPLHGLLSRYSSISDKTIIITAVCTIIIIIILQSYPRVVGGTDSCADNARGDPVYTRTIKMIAPRVYVYTCIRR